MTKTEMDDINSLCKKYFTPQLCDEIITESERSLFIKLYTQLQKYAYKISKNYSSLIYDDIEDVIQNTITECFAKWREEPKTNYTDYFSISIKHAFDKANIDAKRKKDNERSMDDTISDDNKTLEQSIADEKQNKKYPELNSIVERLDKLDSFFTKWSNGKYKKRAHKKDESTINCLSALLTYEMKDDFIQWGLIIKQEYKRNYSFVDKRILNMEKSLSKAGIAALYGLSATRASHILSDFLDEAVKNNSDN
ncbi:MAG: hypothetical protein J6X78_06770 [Treponema sp.]|nr:hypothetical protein [Treponema sp.]